MKLDRACVLLTGAAGGIGREIAQALAGRGARLLLVGRRPGPLAELAGALAAEHGGRCGPAESLSEGLPLSFSWLAADLDTAAGQAACVQAARAAGVNLLLHAAGRAAFGRLAGTDPAELAAVIQTNLIAPMQLSQALLPQLLRQPEAGIVALGSALGRLGLPGHAVYGASKFGLRGFCEALRRELAGTPVRVQYLGPRAVATAFNSPEAEAHREATGSRADPPEAVAAALLKLIDSGAAEAHLGGPERLAGAVNALWPGLLDRPLAAQARLLPP